MSSADLHALVIMREPAPRTRLEEALNASNAERGEVRGSAHFVDRRDAGDRGRPQ